MRWIFLLALALHAETGREAWLRYERLAETPPLPAVVATTGADPLLATAQQELIRGLRGLTGRTLRAEPAPKEPAILLRTGASLPPDAYSIRSEAGNLTISAANGRGVLYGAFAFLRHLAAGEPFVEQSEPRIAARWVNEWNNLDGSIERGYAGRSIFWDNNRVRDDLTRVSEYARLLASVGINACSINNVNANPRILSPEFVPQIAKIADAMRPWGVHVAIAVDFGSPKSIGGLDTFDPLDAKVAAWWKERFDAIYAAIPDFAGVVLKADSEGRVGPATYNRTHADAPNVLARALPPHHGLL
jgi:alpha-glucuronidase